MTEGETTTPTHVRAAMAFDRHEAKLDRDDRIHREQRLIERISRILGQRDSHPAG